jgi:carbamoyltransferase
MQGAFLGPAFGPIDVDRLCRKYRARRTDYADFGRLSREVSALLADGQVVGWFQGRMELGPRALGQRSILANPCDPAMKDLLNSRIKHREPFRPYGVGVLLDHVGDFFEFDRPSPYMLQVARVRREVAHRIPSALHINGTSRLQTVTREDNGIYHDVIEAFYRRTGVPMVINTSFNDQGEPIVCSPEDALDCWRRTGLDALAIGSFLVG